MFTRHVFTRIVFAYPLGEQVVFVRHGVAYNQAQHERVVFRVWVSGNIPYRSGVVHKDVRPVPAGEQTVRLLRRCDFRVLSALRRPTG